jgi:hypothetical protein
VPYANPFIKVNINGHFGPSATSKLEFWNTGFHLVDPGGAIADPAAITAYLTAIAPAISTFHALTALRSGQQAFLDELTGAYIGTDGKYVGGALQPTSKYTYATPQAGVFPGNAPYSQALVLTLRSLRLRGAASHGRMYWPALALNPDPTIGVLTTTVPPQIATGAQAMINAFNTQAHTVLSSGWNVSLVSRVGSGFTAVVNKVLVGGRLDSMESRERNLSEAYASATVTVSSTLLEQDRERIRQAMLEDLGLEDVNPASEAAAE